MAMDATASPQAGPHGSLTLALAPAAAAAVRDRRADAVRRRRPRGAAVRARAGDRRRLAARAGGGGRDGGVGAAVAAGRRRAAGRASGCCWSARFGLALAGMNGAFYLAIDRLPLGTAVALEFVGPIVVTAIGSHGRRDLLTLATAAAGVLLLADVHVSGSPLGVALALAAGACWAGYVVLGHRVAADPGISGRPGLAAAMIAGAVVLAPFGAPASLDAFTAPGLLAACVGVGLMSSVIPYALDQIAMVRLPRARFALLLALLPATATVAGLVVLQQVPGVAETIGIALVVAATALGVASALRKRPFEIAA